MADPLEAARDAFDRRAWADAQRRLGAMVDDLDAPDLERLAVASYLTGEDDESVAAWEAAHRRHLEAGRPAEAATCSFWLALCLLLRGRMAQAGGWLARTESILEESEVDAAARGFLLIPALLGALESGDAEGARELAVRATEIGIRLDTPDLRAFGTLGQGQALLALGEIDAGRAKLDEVMVSVTTGEVGPIASGIVYCAVVLACMKIHDLPRASEWTDALSTWCDAQPDLVPYRGQCLVHRSQVQQASGDWSEAMTTVESARERLADPPHPALGLARYQAAELHRLLGDFDAAEAEYRQANRAGHEPMPGLALLELVRGDPGAAATTIGRALQETSDPLDRPSLLAAAVEIYRVAALPDAAREAADELAALAAASTSSVLGAMAAQARGAVVLTEGDPVGALPLLREAARGWQDLNLPYEAARTAVLLGLACAALGDRTSAELELDKARATFTELGARPDLERLPAVSAEATSGGDRSSEPGDSPLSEREREVLGQVAAGKTNREIADALVISQHTVGRHLENIFTKLGVSSRAAATSYAYEHDLL